MDKTFLAQLFNNWDNAGGRDWKTMMNPKTPLIHRENDPRSYNPGDIRSTNPNAQLTDDPNLVGSGNWEIPNSYLAGAVPLHGKSLDQMPDLNQYGGGGGNDTRYRNYR